MKLTPLICWSLIVCIPLTAWPQTRVAELTASQKTKQLAGEQSAQAKREVQKRGTGERSRVKVMLRNKTEVKGYISQIDAGTFQVTDRKSGHVTTVAYQDVTRIHRSGMSSGAKIALVAGIGVAAIVFWVVLHQQLNRS
jgi:hypothetical protein